MKSLITRIGKFSGIILSICALIYIWGFTENRYESTSQFTVIVEDGTNADASMGLISLIGQSGGAQRERQAAIGYIQSADLLLELEKEFHLKEHYTNPPKDWFFKLNPSYKVDDRLTFYRNRIQAIFDPATGLCTLTVDTFSPELSLKVSNYILKKTENFVNKLNQETATKRLIFIRSEVERAQENFKKKRTALLQFQNKHQVIQPEIVIKAHLEYIQTLKLEKIKKEIHLATIKASSPGSPLIPQIEITIKNLGKEIDHQKEALSGAKQGKLNQLLAEYKNLELDLEFATKLKTGSELILEKTRSESISHSAFFSIIQHPYLSEEKIHPRRIYLSITVIAFIFLGQYILQALIKSIYDRV